MKKYALLLLSGSILTLAACGSNENNTTQAQIDSTAAARSAAMETDLKAKNDSLINEMAKMRADSAMKTSAPATTTTTTTVPAQTHASVRTSSHSSSTKGTKTTSTKATTPPNSTITKEQKQQQDNKFNER